MPGQEASQSKNSMLFWLGPPLSPASSSAISNPLTRQKNLRIPICPGPLPCYPLRAGQSYQWQGQVSRTQHWSDLQPLWGQVWQCGPLLAPDCTGKKSQLYLSQIVSSNVISWRQFLQWWGSFQSSHKTVGSIKVVGHTGRERTNWSEGWTRSFCEIKIWANSVCHLLKKSLTFVSCLSRVILCPLKSI